MSAGRSSIAAERSEKTITVHYRQLAIDNVNVFYREAGNPRV
jgi:hypothetical protein